MDEPRTPHAWLTAERLRLYPAALLFALVVAVALSVITADGSGTATGRLGGDLPAFFGAGRLVLDGRVAELYDWSAQQQAQVGLHPPGEEGRFLAFAYPPFVAVPYAAMVPLGYVGAYVVHTLFMAGLLAGSVALLRPVLPRVGRHPFAAFVGALCLLPLFRAVTGGQNTALTLALMVAWWRLWHDGRHALSGIPLGLLLFKPQLGIPLAGLVLLRRKWRVLPAYLGTAAALWGLGALLGGVGWVGWWWSQVSAFHARDQAVNAPNSVGILGVLEAWLGAGSPVALGLAVPLVGLLVLWLMRRWWRGSDPLAVRMAVTVPALVLVPPHAMHYDSGLVALAWLVLADRLGRAGLSWLLVLFAASALGELRGVLGWDPMVLVLIATVAWAARLPVQRLATGSEASPRPVVAGSG